MTTITLVLLIIQLCYWHYFFAKLAHPDPNTTKQPLKEPITVLIAAKNEKDKLSKMLPVLDRLDYEHYEVIVMDDHSIDDTESIFRGIDKTDRKIAYHKVNQNADGKKQALKEGIDKSSHDVLLMTDADCLPVSDQWIKSMSSQLGEPEKQIVLGYSPYRTTGTFLSLWVHFENWLVGIQYLSYAMRGLPYMGVGRNLMYRKEIYAHSMIDKYAHLASGDDDLTIMQMATPENTSVCLDPESFVSTEPPNSWSAYRDQKRRHYSTAPYYKFKHQVLLGSYGLSQVLFYIAIFIMIYLGSWKTAISLYLIRLLMIMPVMESCRKKLEAQFTWSEFILLDALLAVYYSFFGVVSLIPFKKKW